MITRRKLLRHPLVLTAAASAFGPVLAQGPTPIKFIVPGSAGTGADTVARFMSKALEKPLGTSILVDNRPGAGGVIGTDSVAKAAPDGTTVMVFSANHYVLPLIYDKVPYTLRDFAPVAAFGSSILVLVVAPDSPYSTLKDIIAAARKDGSSLSFSSAGNGTLSHMSGALLNSMAGTKINHVPYKSASQGLLDVSSGAVTMGFIGVAAALPLIKANRLKLVAVTSPQRSAYLPDAPTMSEAGAPGFDITSPFFALVPAATPAPVIQRLAKAFVDTAGSPAFKEFCAAQTFEPDVQDTAALAAAMPRDAEKWKKLVELTQAKGS